MELINKTKSSLALSMCLGVASYASLPANAQVDVVERLVVMDRSAVEEGFSVMENELFCERWRAHRDGAKIWFRK